ncbi:2014_t:CDS:2, partial [Scutellospora calospora]
MDLRHLPTAYSTVHPPCLGLCDSCGHLLVDNNSMVFVCDHSYHNNCYGADTLTKKDLDNDDDDIESNEEESEEIEKVDISPRLIMKMNQIEHWQ